MLDDLHLKALRQLNRGFFFMSPFPLEWDQNEGLLKLRSSRCYNIPFFITISFCGILALSGWYAIVTHLIWGRKDMDMTYLGIEMVGTGALSFSWVLSALCLHQSGLILATNTLLRMANLCHERFPQPRTLSIIDYLLVPAFPAAILTPWIIDISALIFSFDPLYYVFEDLLGDPIYHTRKGILVTFCIRVVVLIGAFECTRIISYAVLTGVIIMYNFRIFSELSLNQFTNPFNIVTAYQLVAVLERAILPLFCIMLSFAISSVFWLLICLWWLAIKGLLVVPIFCYLLTIIFAVFTTLELLIGLKLVVTQITDSSQNVLDYCSRLVLDHQDSYVNTREMRRQKATKYLVRKLRSFKSVRFYYFSNIRIDESFQTDVLKNMVQRLFDALMIF